MEALDREILLVIVVDHISQSTIIETTHSKCSHIRSKYDKELGLVETEKTF